MSITGLFCSGNTHAAREPKYSSIYYRKPAGLRGNSSRLVGKLLLSLVAVTLPIPYLESSALCLGAASASEQGGRSAGAPAQVLNAQ